MAKNRDFVGMSDENLMLAIQRGSGRDLDYAFAELVHRYRAKMLASAKRILHDVDRAEDAVQSAFLKIYRHRMGFKHESSLSTWIFRITTNEALMVHRRMRAHHLSLDAANLNSGRLLVEALSLPNVDPAHLYEQEMLRRIIVEAVEKLGRESRQVFILRHVYERSVQEIADELGISEAAAKSRLHRARVEVSRFIRQPVHRSKRGGS